MHMNEFQVPIPCDIRVPRTECWLLLLDSSISMDCLLRTLQSYKVHIMEGGGVVPASRAVCVPSQPSRDAEAAEHVAAWYHAVASHYHITAHLY